MCGMVSRFANVAASAGLVLGLLLCPVHAQKSEGQGPEYRLRTREGVPFAFDNSEARTFSPLPFITPKDFASVSVRRSNNPNDPGRFEVVLTHTRLARAKFRAVADADRGREYCLIFQRRVYQCFAFAPVQKGVYDKGIVVYAIPTRREADELANAMRRELVRAKRGRGS
jgi:hypothetical protein